MITIPIWLFVIIIPLASLMVFASLFMGVSCLKDWIETKIYNYKTKKEIEIWNSAYKKGYNKALEDINYENEVEQDE